MRGAAIVSSINFNRLSTEVKLYYLQLLMVIDNDDAVLKNDARIKFLASDETVNKLIEAKLMVETEATYALVTSPGIWSYLCESGDARIPLCAPKPPVRRELKQKNPGSFDRFWSAYPKKAAKKSAQQKWDKLNPSRELEETILADIQHRLQDENWKKDGGQYIPLPTTYINGRRWEDEGVDLNGKSGESNTDIYSGLSEEQIRWYREHANDFAG